MRRPLLAFPGGAANSLVTLALQVRFSLFAQHVHNIYFAEFPQIGSGESPRFTESERSSKAHATCLFIFEAGIVNQRCERAVGVDAEVEVLVYKKVGAGTLADDFEHTLQNTCHGVKGYADNPEFWYMAAIA